MSVLFASYMFSEPVPFSLWNPPGEAGVYTVLVRDPKVKPKKYRPIYFGESGNLSEPGLLKTHPRYMCWLKEAGAESGLFVAVHPMPRSTADRRVAVAVELIEQYDPYCNY